MTFFLYSYKQKWSCLYILSLVVLFPVMADTAALVMVWISLFYKGLLQLPSC